MRYTSFVFSVLFSVNSCAYQYSTTEFKNIPHSSNASTSGVIIEKTNEGIFCCLASCVFGESKNKKAAKRFTKDRSWINNYYQNYEAADFAKIFEMKVFESEYVFYETVFDDPIFNKFSLYRLRAFKEFLYSRPYCSKRILEIKHELRQGKLFDLSACSQDEFEQIINVMVRDIPYSERCHEDPYFSYNPSAQFKQQEQIKSPPENKSQELSLKQEEESTYRSQITFMMSDPANDILDRYEWSQEVDIGELFNDNLAQSHYFVRRIEALSDYAQGTVCWQERTYEIPHEVEKLLSDHAIKTTPYMAWYGNQVQHVLHQEFIAFLNDTALLRYQSNTVSDFNNITTTLTRFADAGQQYNHSGYVKDACTLADFCWGMLNAVKDGCVFTIELAQSFDRGVEKGIHNFADKVKNPIKTIRETRRNVRALAQTLIELVEQLKHGAFVIIKNRMQQRMQDLLDGRFDSHSQGTRSLDEILELYKPSVDKVSETIEYVWGAATRENILYSTERVSAVATEMALNQATMSALSSLSVNGSLALKEAINAGGGAGNFWDMPCTPGTFQAGIAYEMTFASEGAAVIEAGGAVVAEALDKVAIIAPGITLASNGGQTVNGPKISLKGMRNAPNPLMDVLQVENQPPKTYAEGLSAKYDNVCFFNGLPIKFRYDHNWNGDINKEGGLGGLHHDILCYLENQGLVQKGDIFPEDFYEGFAYFQGKWEKKSWFPNKWTIADVMQGVFDTIKNPTTIQKQGVITVLEKIRPSGVKIRVVVNNVTGYCYSFYPRFK